MNKTTKEEQKIIENKLNKINIDIYNIPDIFKLDRKISYSPLRGYDNNYKIYHYVDIKNIEIYLTPTTRLESTEKKYKLAQPLISYLMQDKEELLENHVTFLKLLKELDLDKLNEIEEEQKKLQKKVPYEVKYKENFIWEVYYSKANRITKIKEKRNDICSG